MLAAAGRASRRAAERGVAFAAPRVEKVKMAGHRMMTSAPLVEESYPGAMKVCTGAWLQALIGCFGFVKLAQNTKDKKEKGNLMWYHKSFGLLMAGMLIPRVGIRLASRVPALMEGPAWEHAAAKATHAFIVYGGIAFMPISGVAMGYFGGKGLPFFWTKVPGASKENKNGKLAGKAYKAHKFVGKYGAYLVPLHVGAVGYHHLFKGQKILARMNPFT